MLRALLLLATTCALLVGAQTASAVPPTLTVGALDTTDLRLSGDVTNYNPAPGDTVTMTWTLENHGPGAAMGTHLTFATPTGWTALVSSMDFSCGGGPAVDCSVASLAAGATATVTVDLTISSFAAGPLVQYAHAYSSTPNSSGSGIADDNTSAAIWMDVNGATGPATYDLAGYGWSQGSILLPGTSSAFTLELANNSDGIVPAGATISTTLPPMWTIDSTDPDCGVTGQTVTCVATSTFYPGDSVDFGFMATPASASLTPYTLTATAVPPNGNDTNSTNNASTFDVLVSAPGSVDLGPSINVPGALRAGRIEHAYVSVGNGAPSASTGSSVTITLTDGTSTIAGTPTGAGWSCGAPTTTAVTCTYGALAGNDFTSDIDVPVTRASAGPLAISATVTTADTELDPSNNTYSDTWPVAASPQDVGVEGYVSGSPFTVGDTGTATAVAANRSNADATGVELSFTLSQVLSPGAVLPGGCTAVGQVVTCVIGTVLAGDYTSVTIPISADTAGPGSVSLHVSASAGNPDPSNDTMLVPVSVKPVPSATATDVSIETSVEHQFMNAGQSVLVRTTVRNEGANNADDVHAFIGLGPDMTLTGPSGTDFEIVGGSAPACTQVAGGLSCDVGTLAAGASAVIDMRPVATGAGKRVFTASVTTSTEDTASWNNESLWEITVFPSANADVAMWLDYQGAPTGDSYDVTGTVTNESGETASGVTATLSIPAGVTVAHLGSSQGACTATATLMTCSLGTIPAHSAAAISFRADQPIGKRQYVGSVSTSTTDGDADNNSTDITITRLDPTSVDLVASAYDDGAVDGTDHRRMTVSLENWGPATATGVSYKVYLPAGTTLAQAAMPNTGTCSASVPAGGVLTCSAASLATNETLYLSLELDPTTTGSHSITVVATAAQTDARPVSNSAFGGWSSDVNPANVELLASGPERPLPAGKVGHVRFDVHNIGDLPATSTALTISAPSGVTVSSATAAAGSCTGTTTVNCTIGTVNPGDYVSIELEVTGTAAGGHVFNGSVIASNDSESSDNLAAVPFEVLDGPGTADVSIVDASGIPLAAPGDKVQLGWTVRNNGPDAATGVSFNTQLPVGVAFDSASTTQGAACTFTAVTRNVACPMGTLGVTSVAFVRVKVHGTAAGSYTATGLTTSGITDSITTNDSADAHLDVSAPFGVAPASVSFGSVPMGTTSATRVVTITTLYDNYLGPIDLVGTHAAQFHISATTCGMQLSAASSCTVSLVLHPGGAEGARSASLRFFDPDGEYKLIPLVGIADSLSTGTPGGDSFIGTAGADLFYGYAGKDVFNGAAGNDRFFGGAGNDTGNGGTGNDQLYGDAGNDKLIGGPGKDKLFGGAGNDVIDAADRKSGDVIDCGPGKDIVTLNKGDKSKHCEKIRRRR